jgi:hypothetical protein
MLWAKCCGSPRPIRLWPLIIDRLCSKREVGEGYCDADINNRKTDTPCASNGELDGERECKTTKGGLPVTGAEARLKLLIASTTAPMLGPGTDLSDDFGSWIVHFSRGKVA